MKDITAAQLRAEKDEDSTIREGEKVWRYSMWARPSILQTSKP
jgi:hypothetical protein